MSKNESNIDRLRELADKLTNAEYALAHVNGILAAIVEGSSEGILSKDLDGILLTWNPAAERLYGYKAEEVIGQHVSIIVPENKLDELQEIMDRVAHGEATLVETERIRKDRKRIFVKLTVSPIRDLDGKIVGASAIAHPAQWQWDELDDN